MKEFMEAQSKKIFSNFDRLKIPGAPLPLFLQPCSDCPVCHHLIRRAPSPLILIFPNRTAQNQISAVVSKAVGGDDCERQSRFGCMAEIQIKRHDKDFSLLWPCNPILVSSAQSRDYKGGETMNWQAIQRAWERGDRDIAASLLRSMLDEMRFEQKTLSCFMKNGEAGKWG